MYTKQLNITRIIYLNTVQCAQYTLHSSVYCVVFTVHLKNIPTILQWVESCQYTRNFNGFRIWPNHILQLEFIRHSSVVFVFLSKTCVSRYSHPVNNYKCIFPLTNCIYLFTVVLKKYEKAQFRCIPTVDAGSKQM